MRSSFQQYRAKESFNFAEHFLGCGSIFSSSLLPAASAARPSNQQAFQRCRFQGQGSHRFDRRVKSHHRYRGVSNLDVDVVSATRVRVMRIRRRRSADAFLFFSLFRRHFFTVDVDWSFSRSLIQTLLLTGTQARPDADCRFYRRLAAHNERQTGEIASRRYCQYQSWRLHAVWSAGRWCPQKHTGPAAVDSDNRLIFS